jgi:hypothetical protein
MGNLFGKKEEEPGHAYDPEVDGSMDDMTEKGSFAGGAWEDPDEELPRLTREQLLHHLSERQDKFRHVKSVPFTVLLLSVYSVVLFAHLGIDETRAMATSVSDALRQRGATGPSFAEIETLPEIWEWLDGGLVPKLFLSEEEWIEQQIALFEAKQRAKAAGNATGGGTPEEVPSQKAVHPLRRYTMAVGALVLKHEFAYEAPCPNEAATGLLYRFDTVEEACYPESLPAAACWDNKNCSYRNGTHVQQLTGERLQNTTRTRFGDELIFVPLDEQREAVCHL